METWVGLVPDIFNSMARHLNFTFTLALSRDGAWGSKNASTGKWSGIIGDLIEDEADIAVAPLSVTKGRAEVPLHWNCCKKIGFNILYFILFNFES